MVLSILILLNFISFLGGGHELFPVFGYSFTHWDLTSIMLIIYTIKRIFWNGDKVIISKNYILTGLFIFILSLLLSIFVPIFAGNRDLLLQVIKTTTHLFFYIAYFFSFTLINIETKHFRFFAKSILIIALITNIFAVYQLFARLYDLPLKTITFYNTSSTTRGGFESNELDQLALQFENFTRATSYMSEPSALANTNCFFLIFMLVPYLTKKKPFFNSRVFNTINFIALLTGLFLTFSLTGVFGVLLLLFVAIFIHNKLKIINFLKIFSFAILIIAITDIFAEKFFDISVLGLFNQRISSLLPFKNNKTQQIEGESLEHRSITFNQSLKIWKENPIFGIGLGLSSSHKDSELPFSDTSIMAMLGEAGIFGGISLIIFFLCILIYSIDIIKDKKLNQHEEPEVVIFSAIPLYIFPILFTSNFLTGNQIINAGFWQIFVFVIGLINLSDKKRNKNLIEINFVKEGISLKLARGLNTLQNTLKAK